MHELDLETWLNKIVNTDVYKSDSTVQKIQIRQ